ncbi:unnamed protein product [Heligmosomoides polygyrus]|uniref:Uncharacterized protein n=1 Tax=Heligmosomoides polygyrus TaxID=6339 RepID=A0A183FGD1_HELPZ|nr:unnamed protein product [Heligmosomoides polygyrus]
MADGGGGGGGGSTDGGNGGGDSARGGSMARQNCDEFYNNQLSLAPLQSQLSLSEYRFPKAYATHCQPRCEES